MDLPVSTTVTTPAEVDSGLWTAGTVVSYLERQLQPLDAAQQRACRFDDYTLG